MDLDFRDCFGRNKLRLITEEIRYKKLPRLTLLQLLPKHSVQVGSQKKKTKKEKRAPVQEEEEKPGKESMRKNRENFTR